MPYNFRIDGWALIGAWASIGMNAVKEYAVILTTCLYGVNQKT